MWFPVGLKGHVIFHDGFGGVEFDASDTMSQAGAEDFSLTQRESSETVPSIALAAGYFAICELAGADLKLRGFEGGAAEAAIVRSRLVSTMDFIGIDRIGATGEFHIAADLGVYPLKMRILPVKIRKSMRFQKEGVAPAAAFRRRGGVVLDFHSEGPHFVDTHGPRDGVLGGGPLVDDIVDFLAWAEAEFSGEFRVEHVERVDWHRVINQPQPLMRRLS